MLSRPPPCSFSQQPRVVSAQILLSPQGGEASGSQGPAGLAWRRGGAQTPVPGLSAESGEAARSGPCSSFVPRQKEPSRWACGDPRERHRVSGFCEDEPSTAVCTCTSRCRCQHTRTLVSWGRGSAVASRVCSPPNSKQPRAPEGASRASFFITTVLQCS